MSVSFLVEASDVPQGAKLMAFEMPKENSSEEVAFSEFQLLDMPNGLASWYGKGFHGRRTASGRKYDMYEMTAAHKSLPFGTLLKVMNVKTGEAVIVDVSVRGPFIRKRVVDLSYASAKMIGVTVTPVELQALTPESVATFYKDNDSSVMVISESQSVQVWPTQRIQKISDETSYSNAMKKRTEGEVILMQSDVDAKTVYSVARILSDDVAYGE